MDKKVLYPENANFDNDKTFPKIYFSVVITFYCVIYFVQNLTITRPSIIKTIFFSYIM